VSQGPQGRELVLLAPITFSGDLLGYGRVALSLADLDQERALALRTLILMTILATLVVGTALALSVLRNATRPLREITGMVAEIAQGAGDLTKRVREDTVGEIGALGTWFNRFLNQLSGLIHQSAQTSQRVAVAAEELAAGAAELARGAAEQTQRAGQVAASVEEMSASVLQVARNAQGAASAAKEASATAERGGEIVRRTVAGMGAIARSVEGVAGTIGALGRRSDQIGEIVKVIDEIADQTNLLALNAAIEAARAGEQGRGFAVVADEVRRLAERTGKATKEIAEMIRAIQGEAEVRQGVALAQEAGQALDAIVGVVGRLMTQVAEIATAAEQQSASAEEISANVEGVATLTKQAQAAAQGTAHATEDLSRLATELRGIVGRFRLEG
jgi:methyl-accepting chemotaxis protein